MTDKIDTQKIMVISPWKAGDALAVDDPALQPFLTFADRESYLAWRAEWKEAYRDLSAYIRFLRKQFRSEGSDHEVVTVSLLYSNRALARTMLALRHASKVKAEALYQASKEASQVA